MGKPRGQPQFFPGYALPATGVSSSRCPSEAPRTTAPRGTTAVDARRKPTVLNFEGIRDSGWVLGAWREKVIEPVRTNATEFGFDLWTAPMLTRIKLLPEGHFPALFGSSVNPPSPVQAWPLTAFPTGVRSRPTVPGPCHRTAAILRVRVRRLPIQMVARRRGLGARRRRTSLSVTPPLSRMGRRRCSPVRNHGGPAAPRCCHTPP